MSLGLRLWVKSSRSVVSASVPVLGKGVFHAVVVQEVGGVVVVVEVFVPPEMSLYDFAGLKAVASGGHLAVVSSGFENPRFIPWYEVRHSGLAIVSFLVAGARSWVGSWCDVRECGLAVAECGAQIVAVRSGDWTFTDEAGDIFGC